MEGAAISTVTKISINYSMCGSDASVEEPCKWIGRFLKHSDLFEKLLQLHGLIFECKNQIIVFESENQRLILDFKISQFEIKKFLTQQAKEEMMCRSPENKPKLLFNDQCHMICFTYCLVLCLRSVHTICSSGDARVCSSRTQVGTRNVCFFPPFQSRCTNNYRHRKCIDVASRHDCRSGDIQWMQFESFWPMSPVLL